MFERNFRIQLLKNLVLKNLKINFKELEKESETKTRVCFSIVT